MSGYNEKSIRIVQYSGKKDDWRMWHRQFLAMAGKKKCKEVLLGTVTVPKASDTLNETTDSEKIKAREANENAYHNLILANAHQVAFNLVDQAVSDELPDGDAKLAWDRLKGKYDSSSASTMVQLSKKFMDLKLTNSKTDPEEWIVELEILRARLERTSYKITENHLLVHILQNVPKEYDTVVEMDGRLLSCGYPGP